MNTFDPHIRIQQITLVGVGGTGAQLARLIARILYDMRERVMDTPHLHIVDPDVIESKNVGRQLYAPGDVGKSKAQVAATRLNHVLGLDITYVDDTFDADRDVKSGTVICGAVDNHLARRDIHESAREFRLWIDTGNHFDSGQIIIGNSNDAARMLDQWRRQDELDEGKPGAWSYLPLPSLIFPSLLEPDDPDPTPAPDLSCADLVTLGEQHLLINDMVAGVAATYVFNLLHRRPITSFMTFVSLNPITIKSIPITREDVEANLPEMRMTP